MSYGPYHVVHIMWSILCGPYHMVFMNIHMIWSWSRSNSRPEQGSVGRDESSWDGPRPSSSSGRDEINFKFLGTRTGRGRAVLEFLGTSGPQIFGDEDRTRTSYFRSYGGLRQTKAWYRPYPGKFTLSQLRRPLDT